MKLFLEAERQALSDGIRNEHRIYLLTYSFTFTATKHLHINAYSNQDS